MGGDGVVVVASASLSSLSVVAAAALGFIIIIGLVSLLSLSLLFAENRTDFLLEPDDKGLLLLSSLLLLLEEIIPLFSFLTVADVVEFMTDAEGRTENDSLD